MIRSDRNRQRINAGGNCKRMNARLARLIGYIDAGFPDIQPSRQGIVDIPCNRHTPGVICLLDGIGSKLAQSYGGQSVSYCSEHVIITLQEYARIASVQNAGDIARPSSRIAVGSKHAGRRKRSMTGNRIVKTVTSPTAVRRCKFRFAERLLRLGQRSAAHGALVARIDYVLMRAGFAAHTDTR